MKPKASFKIPSLRDIILTTFGRCNWITKKPIEKWSYLYGIGHYSCLMCGFSIFKVPQNYVYRSSLSYSYTLTYALLAIYTIYFHMRRGDPGNSLSCTCLLVGPILTVRSKHCFVIGFMLYSWFYHLINFRAYQPVFYLPIRSIAIL